MSALIDMKKLAGLVRELEEQFSACTRCGMCQAVCPLYRETAQESSVARGKLAILGGLMEEAFKEPRQSLEQISRCLLCGSCEANCPSGVENGGAPFTHINIAVVMSNTLQSPLPASPVRPPRTSDTRGRRRA